MRIIFNAVLDIITQPVVLLLMACPIPFYAVSLVWSAFHVGGDFND